LALPPTAGEAGAGALAAVRALLSLQAASANNASTLLADAPMRMIENVNGMNQNLQKMPRPRAGRTIGAAA
jgi:hypothetical protein